MMKICEARNCHTPANFGGRLCDAHSPCPGSPTPEEIKDAHEALDMLNRIGSKHNSATDLFVFRARKALPLLPETQRPRLTNVPELVERVWAEMKWTSHMDAIHRTVRARDAEIIAWLEWEDEVRGKLPFDSIANRLLRELREADKP